MNEFTSKMLQNEREMIYYGFTIDDLKEDVKDMYKEKLEKVINNFSQAFLAKFGDNPENRNYCQQLFEHLVKDSLESLEKINSCAETLLQIPKDVIVPEFDDIVPVSDKEVLQLEKEIKILEKKHLQNAVYLECLKDCSEKIETISPLVNNVDKTLTDLTLKMEILEQGKKQQEVLEEFWVEECSKNDY